MTWDEHIDRGAAKGAFVGIVFFAMVMWISGIDLPTVRSPSLAIIFLGFCVCCAIGAFFGCEIADRTYKGDGE